MRLTTHVHRGLSYHWRLHFPVMLGVTTATATLTGALLVGDSMRASLRDAALSRLGRVDHALTARSFFREALAAELAAAPGFAADGSQACPLIVVSGGITHAGTGARVNRITVFGIDERFWRLAAPDDAPIPLQLTGRKVILNQPLADQLAVEAGDDVLLRVGKPGSVPTETLLGRRDDALLTLRLSVHGVIPAEGVGGFSLHPRQSLPNNAWVPLATLQRVLKQPKRVNTILVEAGKKDVDSTASDVTRLQQLLQQHATVDDLGIRLRIDSARRYLAIESESLLLDPVVEEAALATARAAGIAASPILTYLANTISKDDAQPADPVEEHPDNNLPVHLNPQSAIPNPQSVIPYSTITALDTSVTQMPSLTLLDGSASPELKPREILLNEWAADDLDVKPGDRVRVTYYVAGPFGRLDTRSESFAVRGIVRMDDVATDLGWTPPYPGITDAQNLADWSPPFPIDFSLIRDKDEAYWDRYRAAPKAFISLAEGRRLWSDEHGRFGRSTSIRMVPPGEADLAAVGETLKRRLIEHVDIGSLGLSFEPVRQQAITASNGATDFGMLFIGFSFFLIISAAMLVALLFRLGVEQRARQVGVLLATGFDRSTVTRLLLAEGVVITVLGAALGLIAAAGYAWLMLSGLKSWWSAAVNAPFLRLYTAPASFLIGFSLSLIIAVASIALAIRSLGRFSTTSLLAGLTGTRLSPGRRRRVGWIIVVGVGALLSAIVLVVLGGVTETLPQTVGFFGGGAAMVVACVSAAAMWMHLDRREMIQRAGRIALLRLGVRNAPRHPGRSLLTVALIASATFVIIAIEALHLNVRADTGDIHSPTGGFPLLAEAAVPLLYDLNTAQGRDALGIAESESTELDGVTVMPFRLRPGGQSSCRNLYRPTKPRIIGAPDAMIERGGFLYSSTLAETEDEERNPWTLLRRTFPDGAVPVIGDESTVLWQFHLGLGKDLVITGERGREVRLRFVALLSGSVLQNELIIAESQFVRLFPSVGGHAFFLLDLPSTRASVVTVALERRLDLFAFDVTPTAQRLSEYTIVQNTYLSTFQTLGGLGLVLGTVGLTVVLLRNVWERRSELALMRALGFSRAALGCIVLVENGVLVVAGLASGTVPALVAITPHISTHPGQLPWLSLGLTLAAVFIVGIGAGALALVPTLRAPLIPALRTE